jgi:hypothetical protein
MSPLVRLRKIFAKNRPQGRGDPILPLPEQVSAWQRANRKMNWGIHGDEFEKLAALPLPPLTDADRLEGFIGTVLFYGFGDDGRGHADVVLSAKLAWNYVAKYRKGKTWQCEYVDFEKPEDIRLRPGAPARPKGFYFARLQLGEKYVNMTASQLRKNLGHQTGCGPEGFQLLTVTHPHIADRMSERRLPFMVLADYDVAPYGYNDFYDAPQLFCSNNILGLGIGNVDRNYPLFGIPTLRLCL